VRTLKLTSPATTGPDVEVAQQLLGQNVFEVDFQPGPVDGEFGPLTAGACKRAKWTLGYPDGDILPTYGDKIGGLLAGTGALPPSFAKRRTVRAATLNRSTLKSRALSLAKREIGYAERPTNRTKFGAWYGMDGSPWCAMFVTWCVVRAGEALHMPTPFRRGDRWAYVPYVVSAAVGGRYELSVTSAPEPGDVVTYDWNRDGTADHIGLFADWIDRGRGTFRAIEGNTSTASNSNGGEVMLRDRDRSEVRAFVHMP
jgi:CHAP domain